VIGLTLKLFRGHVRKHLLETLLCIIGITLGVAVVVGIDLAVDASVGSFRSAVRSLADRATHAVVGNNGPLNDAQFIALKRVLPNARIAPVIDRRVLIDRPAGPVSVRLFGIDPFAERGMRSVTQVDASLDQSAVDRFLTEPGAIVLVEDCAARLGAAVGDELVVIAGTARQTVRMIGTVRIDGPGRAQMADLAVADIATAQELLGLVGQIDRIDAVLESDADLAALTAALPEGLSVQTTDDRAAQLSELIGAYRLNLMALSLMASFVAVFIVYNALLVSVQQRATSLAVLRCLGGSRLQLGSIYLVEALLLAIIGGAIGVLAGWGLSRGLVGLVGNTINDLYATVRPEPVGLDAFSIVKGMTVAIVAGLTGAIVPLLRAAGTPPVSILRSSDNARRAWRGANRLAIIGLALLAIQPALYLLPGESPIVGFAMALTSALGFALICPILTRSVCAMAARVGHRFGILPVQVAAGGVSRALGITGVAVAAMMLAGAMNVGIQTMVASFRGSLETWMDQRFRFDVFVGPQLLVDHKIDAPLPPEALAFVEARPEVERFVTYRVRTQQREGRSIEIVGTQVATLLELQSLQMKSRLPESVAFDPAIHVIASEPLAFRDRLSPGDAMALETPAGSRFFTVFAVHHDFGSERGQLMLDSETYAEAFADSQLTSVHIRLNPGEDGAAVSAEWQRLLSPGLPVTVQHYGGLKREVTEVFDRTFRVTEVISWLAAGVALCGLAGALLALSLARRNEHGVLMALGMSGRQLALRLMTEGLLIALIAASIAIVAGTLLAYILAYVIQYRSFGWSIPTTPQPRFWIEALLAFSTAAIVATLYPLMVLRRMPPVEAMR
jgi:putative ABC transport system permease protein